jgi:hypothetical protein
VAWACYPRQNSPPLGEAVEALSLPLAAKLAPDRIPCSGSCAVCLLDSCSPGRICGTDDRLEDESTTGCSTLVGAQVNPRQGSLAETEISRRGCEGQYVALTILQRLALAKGAQL